MSHTAGATGPSARREWAAAWPMPLIGMLGVVTSSAFVYSSGVFMTALTHEFGWTRAQFASAFTIQMLVGIVMGPLVGRAVDRFGPRSVALAGLCGLIVGLPLLGLANGSIWQWRMLCIIEGIGLAALSPVTWVTAVAGSFNVARGLALAVVLAGTGVGTALWPWVALNLIGLVGWRLSFTVMAFAAFAVLMPLTLLFFRGTSVVRGPERLPRVPLWPTIRSRTFLCLIVAGCLYASVTLGLTLHLVPILTGNGFTLADAAAAAVVVGVATLVGRLVTGYALDHLPTRIVGLVAFLLPIVEVFCFWQGNGSAALSFAGAALLGLTSGAESDVLVYLASRRLDRSVFASAYAIFNTFFAIAASMGPLIAGSLFDTYGSYDAYFLLCVPIALVAALLISLVPSAPAEQPTEAAG